MKKVLSLALVLALTLTTMVGCGSSKDPAPSTSTPAASSAQKEELPSYNLQLGYNTVEDSVRGEMANVFKSYVEEASEGRITVDIFPNASLGNEQEMIEMVKTGSLDITLGGISAMSNIDSSFGAISLPFLVADYDTAHSMLDGEFGDVLKEIAVKNGYKIMSWGDLGMAQITNNIRPINTVADLKGVNIRSTNEEVSLKTFEALGCSVTTLAFSELYLGLSQGVVDGQFNPVDAIYQNSFTEVQDYLAMVNIFYYGFDMLMGNDRFESMDAETQQILMDGAAKAQEAARTYCVKADSEYLQKVQDENCFVEITYPDTAGFKEATAGVYDSFLTNCDPKLAEVVNAMR